MRVSGYVISHSLPDPRFWILAHGYTGALDKVPESVGRLLMENRGKDLTATQTRELGDRTVEHLTARGYLTRMSAEAERDALIEIATTLHEADLADSPTGFMFIPAYTCNLRCPYCFQSHDMHAGRDGYDAILTPELVDRAFSIIDRLHDAGAAARLTGLTEAAPDPRPSSGDICLFGGEPLASGTRTIVAYIVELASRRGKTVSAITNGVELDLFFDVMGPGRLEEVQITLDGTAGLHDSRRIGPGFRHTFDRISANIDAALALGTRVNLRMNVDATNAAEIEDLGEYCRLRGWTDHAGFFAGAAVVTGETTRKNLITPATLTWITTSLKDRAGWSFAGYERPAREFVKQCLEGEGYPFKRIANCAAETGLLIFDARADVYSCWEDVGVRSRRIGTYDETGLHLEGQVMRRWLSRFPGAIEECSRCPYALIHSSGCAKHAENEHGTMFASACESFQQYFPTTLALAYDAYEATLLGRPIDRQARSDLWPAEPESSMADNPGRSLGKVALPWPVLKRT
jgi:uncharacterized protein